MVVSFRKISSDDQTINRLQDALLEVINPLIAAPTADSIILRNVALKAGVDNRIAHGLGRNYISFTLLAKTAFADYKTSATTNNMRDKQIIVQVTADCVADILVL